MCILPLGPLQQTRIPKNKATVFGFAGCAMAFQAGKFAHFAPHFINEKGVEFSRC